ncbi:MAG TPA: RNA methyltransferase [Polyangiaceae bacterium]|nr:RNA methyltransferase [Polyangiaceae bacterium]
MKGSSEKTSPRVRLIVHEHVGFVLVKPHYPENVGASARAIKTMGFDRLVLVGAGRLAVPEHNMAFKMSVRAWDVLDASERYGSLAEAVKGSLVVATSSHRGLSGVLTARDAAGLLVAEAARGRQIRILFGNEKTGLSAEELETADVRVRLPMAGDQPSINLAQAVQLVAYELFVAGLAARARGDDA